MNKLIAMGRLTRDPEIRVTPDGNMAIARFSLAVDRPRSKEKKTDFFDCKAFGKTAELAEKYLRKGTKILVEGSMQQSEYTNRDGQKVHYWELIIDHYEFCESKGADKPAIPTDDFINLPDALDDADLPFNF